METYRNPVITEQPAPITLQISALVLGIVGFLFSFLSYFVTIFGNIVWIAGRSSSMEMPAVGGIVFAIIAVTMLLCIAAIVLGTIGLIRSIRRPRSVKGIVLSAIGLGLGLGGLIFSFVCLFITGIFSFIIMQM